MSSSHTPSRRLRLAAGPVLVVAAQESSVEPLCRLIEQTIAVLGGFCERVQSGALAMALLRRERPLLIAVAVTAERGDGDELLSSLRLRSDLDDVPVLALVPEDADTPRSDGPPLSIRVYQEGVSDVLKSSATADVVSAKLSAWLQLAGRAHRLWALRDFAHEARHPIAAIGAAAHLLEVSGEDAMERQRLCHAIVSESERLGRMVESYLDADAALRIGDAPLTEAPVRLLSDLLQVSLTAVLRARIDVRVQGELPDLAVEPDHLRQMLLNLLDNALAATAQGGTVCIEAMADEAGVALCVRDTGSGISEDHLGRIFENGFSTRGDRRRGLGLGITQRLAARVGGRVVVNSSLGEGTIFTLWLPRR